MTHCKSLILAEREGFEPPVPFWGTAVFETAAFDHSAISPRRDILITFLATDNGGKGALVPLCSALGTFYSALSIRLSAKNSWRSFLASAWRTPDEMGNRRG
jgi:hypothetical protein